MAVISKPDLNLDNIKAVVFDWDGTLYNNIMAIKTATKDVLDRFEIDHPVDDAVEEFVDLMEEVNTSSIADIVKNSYTILNKISFVKNLPYTKKLQLIFLIYSSYKKYSEQCRLFRGTVELLQNLSEKFDLAIFTSSKRKVIVELLEKFGIKEYFKSILSMDDVKQPKPNPEGILKAISELSELGDYGPDNIIYVGDLKTDILAARAANINSIAVYNGLVSKQQILNQHPDMFCDHVTELSRVFDLPEIKVDKKEDFKLDLDFHSKKIKSYVKEEFNFFELLNDVFPKKLEVEHVEMIVRDPLAFMGAILEDGITRYTHGEFELSNELDVFTGLEEDLLRCLGLILIHFVNERSNNLIGRVVKDRFLAVPSRIFVWLFKLSLKLYPPEYKVNFRNAFLGLFQKIIPEEIYGKLEHIDEDYFSNYVLEGCELALVDLGYTKPPAIGIPINELALPFNLGLRVINRIFEGMYGRFKDLAIDILENDLRHLPTQ